MLIRMLDGWTLFSPEDGGGSGGSGGDSGKTDELRRENEGFKNLLAKHNNDAIAVASELYAENYRFRDDKRELKVQLEEAHKKVPEGSVVLSSDEAKQWEAYKELGKPDAIQGALDKAKQETRAGLISRLATSEGLNEKVLTRLIGDAEIVEEKGKDDKSVFKVGSDKDAKPVSELLEGDWREFAPALSSEKPTGTRVAGQTGSKEGGDVDYVSKYIDAYQPSKPDTKGA